MSAQFDRATDEQLVELFGLDSVEELHSTAAGKGGMLFHAVCDGQWIKYEGTSAWVFQADPDDRT